MGMSGLTALAIALCATFGVGGVLLGLFIGVRTIGRDEERYGAVSLSLDLIKQDMARLKMEWGTTLETMEQLAQAVEKGRRRAAASLSAAERKEAQQASEEPAVPLSSSEQRAMIRRRVRGVA